MKVKKRKIFLFIGIIILFVLSLGIVFGFQSLKKSHNNEIITEEDVSLDEIFYDDNSGVYSTENISVFDKDSINESGLYQQDDISYENKKKIYLTFDDGPSIYTNTILDILKKYNVKATFFVVAKNDEMSKNAYNRIVDEGHTLAMHSYSHKYKEVYKSMDSFKKDISDLQEHLYDITGVWCRIYRFPGGSSNTVSKIPMKELVNYLDEEDITYFDWNISSMDASAGGMLSAETIKLNCIRDIDKYDESVILLHDLSTKKSTVDALDDIIEYIISRDDCVILPITDETNPVHHRME